MLGEKNKSYKLSDFIGKDDSYIKNSSYAVILVDYNTLVNNFDLLKHILQIGNIDKINCLDYDSVLYLEENLDFKVDIALVDDYQNKDRSYIDIRNFEKNKVFIPLSYLMWIKNLEESYNTFCSLNASNISMSNRANSNENITRDTLLKVKELIEKLNMSNLTDVDKCLIVSNYLQSKVQYVDKIESEADKIYIVDTKGEILKGNGLVETVLFENYGVCEGIANATTLLLNNPIFNINARTMSGCGHAWNLITLNNKKYFIDNTWCITRNKDRVKDALKASDFTDKYLLFGSETATLIGHHIPDTYIDGILEQKDYDKEKINEREKVLSKRISFGNYGNSLRFESRIKRIES